MSPGAAAVSSQSQYHALERRLDRKRSHLDEFEIGRPNSDHSFIGELDPVSVTGFLLHDVAHFPVAELFCELHSFD